MAGGPRSVIPAPLALPPRVSLLTLARAAGTLNPDDEATRDPEERWINGFTFEPESCGEGLIVGLCEGETKPVDANAAIVEYDPFASVSSDSCSPFGYQARDWQGRARRKLLACESKQIESELWLGTLAQANGYPNNFLINSASPNFVNLTGIGGPASSRDQALASLQMAIADADCGGPGMIHATHQLVSLWFGDYLIYKEGNLLLDAFGNVIVPGAGYDGSQPDDGSPAPGIGESWAYATSLVYVRQAREVLMYPGDDATFKEGLNRSTDLVTVRAERVNAAYWSGCVHAAILANVCEDCTAGS